MIAPENQIVKPKTDDRASVEKIQDALKKILIIEGLLENEP